MYVCDERGSSLSRIRDQIMRNKNKAPEDPVVLNMLAQSICKSDGRINRKWTKIEEGFNKESRISKNLLAFYVSICAE